MIGDPTLHVLNKIQEVLSELNVTMERYDLYEYKNNIVTLPQTLKDADWHYSGNHSRMVWHRWMDAAVPGFLLALR